MLARNIESVEAQTDPDYEQVFLIGDDISGINGFLKRLGDRQAEYHGQYIYILPDDDLLIDPGFVAELKRVCGEHDPDVVMVKADKLSLGILPSDPSWGNAPVFSKVDILNYVVRADVWKRHSPSFTKKDHAYHGGAFAGDFSFIEDVFNSSPEVYWWDRLVAKSQRISHGKAE